jgi:hypothetical protein
MNNSHFLHRHVQHSRGVMLKVVAQRHRSQQDVTRSQQPHLSWRLLSPAIEDLGRMQPHSQVGNDVSEHQRRFAGICRLRSRHTCHFTSATTQT